MEKKVGKVGTFFTAASDPAMLWPGGEAGDAYDLRRVFYKRFYQPNSAQFFGPGDYGESIVM